MAKSTHGTCPSCKRENVNMPGPNKCSRCYDRIKRGVDVITGEPISAKAPATHVAPAIIADDEPPSEHRVNENWLNTNEYVKGTQFYVPKLSAPKAPLLRAHDFNIKKLSKQRLSDSIPAEIGFITSPGIHVEVIARELFSDEEDLNLLTRLLAIARGNRRTLQGEILYRLDKSLESLG
jgi:hypothetical protein